MIVTSAMIHAPVVELKDLWGTPQPIFDKLNTEYSFTLDPCCTVETAKCKKFYTPTENGLIQDWQGESVFANPPYSRGNIDQWVKKFYQSRRDAIVVALLPVSTSANWWQNWIIGQSLYLVNKRIRFTGAIHKAPFSSVIVHFNDRNCVYSWQQPHPSAS